MSKRTLGLVPAPGRPEKLVEKLIEILPEVLSRVVDDRISWEIRCETNPLASSSEYINENINRADDIRQKNNWDMVIAVTDLPSLSERKVVISEFNQEKGISIISLPALGCFKLKQKLQNLIIHHVEILYGSGSSEENGEVKSQFIDKITSVTPEEDNDSSKRYIIKSTVTGWSRLVVGMTYINEPWTVLTGFKTIVSLAFATGTYISIFSGAWELSLEYDLWRFLLGMFIAVSGMTGWLIYAHRLWEKKSHNSQTLYRSLYNLTTLLTVTSVTLVNYAIVFVLLTISIFLFVPPNLFGSWTPADPNTSWNDYFNLIWFASSLGILAGALGSTVEDEDKIRNVTYSYRQLYRHEQIEKEDETESYEESGESESKTQGESEEQAEEYEGQKQTHRESEEGE